MNLERDTINNTDYRRVIKTLKHMQIVLMSLRPNENIPQETHNEHDQFIKVEQGKCKIITSSTTILSSGDAICIQAGVTHEVINIGDEHLKLYTIYSPPEHKDGLVQHDKPFESSKSIETLESKKPIIISLRHHFIQ